MCQTSLLNAETDIAEKTDKGPFTSQAFHHIQQISQILDRAEQCLETRKKRAREEMDDADIVSSALIIQKNYPLPTSNHQVPTVFKNLPVPGSKKVGTKIHLLDSTSVDITTAILDEWINQYSSCILLPIFSSHKIDFL